jgi:hypothetical protein
LGEPGEELLVTELLPQPTRVLQQSLGAVDLRDLLAGLVAADVLHVAAEDGRLQALGPGQVVGDQQEPFGAEPGMPRGDLGQVGPVQRAGVAVEQGVEHRHEVALAGAERAVQVGGLRTVLVQRGLDQAERLAERHPQLGRDDVAVQRLVALGVDALGQFEDEVAPVDARRDVDQLPEQRHRARPGGGHAGEPLGSHSVETGGSRPAVVGRIGAGQPTRTRLARR